MTNQEAFEKVANHLLTQMEPSVGPAGCRYRANNGLKCAIGCLIPDDKYYQDLEGLGAKHESVLAAISDFCGDASLLFELQLIHDQHDPEQWRNRLKNLAVTYNLEANF